MNNQTLSSFQATSRVLLIICALNFFFLSISLLGSFKDLGAGYGQTLLVELANSPFLGLLIGILITSIAQSSSVTTSIVVGFAASGVYGETLEQSIRLALPIIMGANIGTTVTNMLVSMGHIRDPRAFQRAFAAAIVHDFFNILTVLIFFPLQVTTNFLGRAAAILTENFGQIGGFHFASPIKTLVNPQKHFIAELFQNQDLVFFVVTFFLLLVLFFWIRFFVNRMRDVKRTEWLVFLMSVLLGIAAVLGRKVTHYIFTSETATFLLGLGILFSSLYVFVKTMRSMVLTSLEKLFHAYIFKTPARAMTLGLIITAIIQSSSVTTSLAVPLAGAGIITIYQVFPYTLGANAGTTVTAILAALSTGSPAGIGVAFSHLLFNLAGMLVFYFNPMKKIPINAALLFSEKATKSKVIPIIFILTIFILVPFLIILFFR